MSLEFDVRPEPLGQVVLGTAYTDIFECPAVDADSNPVKSATILTGVVANTDLAGSVRTAHRVWIDKLPAAGAPATETAQVPGELVNDRLDFHGELVLLPGEKLVGKADAPDVIAATFSGGLTVFKP